MNTVFLFYQSEQDQEDVYITDCLLAFADDVVISRTVNELLGAFEECEEAARKAGVVIKEKIKYMIITSGMKGERFIEGTGLLF